MGNQVHVYYARERNCSFVLADGSRVCFEQGRFHTTNEEIIAQLDKEIALGHPTFYVNENAKVVDVDSLDPMKVLRKTMEEELRAQIKEELEQEQQQQQEVKPVLGGIGTTASAGQHAAMSITK